MRKAKEGEGCQVRCSSGSGAGANCSLCVVENDKAINGISLGPVLLCLSLLVDRSSVISLPFFCRTFTFTVEGS